MFAAFQRSLTLFWGKWKVFRPWLCWMLLSRTVLIQAR